MLYRSLTKKKFKVSRLGLGTVNFGMDYGFNKAKTQDEVDQILLSCRKFGINFLDTAREYQTSEEKIGSFHRRNPGHDFLIATKLSRIPPASTENSKKLAEHIHASVKLSLNFLALECIPMLQLHQTEEFLTGNEHFWKIIGDLRRQKLIGAFGISVYEVEETRRLINRYTPLIDFIQIPYNVFDQSFKVLFPLLKEKKIDVVSRSAFLKGIIAAKDADLPLELEEIKPYRRKLMELAKEFGLFPEALALLFVLGHKEIDTTIVGVNSALELQVNVKILEQTEQFKDLGNRFKNLAVTDPFLIDPRRWKDL